MFLFENLLRNEYFPAELPPCFNSESFADNYLEIEKLIKSETFSPSDPLIFSGYKNTKSRRKFAIPNPYHYANAANIIVSHSAQIFNIYEKNNTSLTVPIKKIPKQNECYKKTISQISERKDRIKKLYSTNLYEVIIDIQSFFDSVYTHSISWAMHTKKVAKKRKNDNTLAGNLIDRCIQNINSGQTNGILVGNAISRIASEIILCAVDKEIKARLPEISYLRYVDDYYIFVKDSSTINSVLAVFRQELANYELLINESKLKINESPFIYGKPWVEQMRTYARLEPQLLLEKAIIEYHSYNDIAILKYAINVLRTLTFSSSEWKNIQPVIFNLFVRFPSLSKTITIILKNNEKKLSLSLLKKSIYTILDMHVPLKNDEEVIWAIWISKIFNVRLSQDYIKLILDTNNWLAIIILLDELSSKKAEPSTKKIIDKLRKRIIDEYFYDSAQSIDNMHKDIWLLAYEADKNKWLNTGSNDTFLFARKHPFFKKLKELDIEFYYKNYRYEVLDKPKEKANIYVTHKELVSLLEEYKLSIETKKDDKVNGDLEQKEVFDIFEKIKKILENIEDIEAY